MPTYAVLGATGQTGSELVKLLLPTSNHLNIYARSASRLAAKLPSLSSAENVTTFIGDLNDARLLDSCLADVDVIFSTVAQNQNEPGCSIAQRTATAIVQSLERLQSTGAKKCPVLIFLASSAIGHTGQRLIWLLHLINYHVYTDLENAIAYLRSNSWLPLIIAAPGGLIQGQAHKVELTEEMGSDMGTYMDLATGMMMMAEDGRWVGKQVGMVVNEGRAVKGNFLSLARYILPNLLGTFCPPLWRLGRNWWPV